MDAEEKFLVLTRELDQEIVVTHIGERLVISVVEFRPGYKVRLGFKALPSFRIHRAEVQSKIDAANQQAEGYDRNEVRGQEP